MSLPKSFWKLTRRWLLDAKGTSEARRPKLFRNSLKAAVLGLSLGVASLSLTLALVRGVQYSLSQGLGRGLGHVIFNTHVWSTYSRLQEFVRVAPSGLVRAEFVWDSQALVLGPKGGRGVKIVGVLPSNFSVTDPYAQRFPLTIDLGKPLAKYLGVNPGDVISLLMPGVVRGRVPARVQDIVEFGYYEYDSRYARIDARGLYAYLKEHQPDLYETRPGDAFMIRYYLDESRYPFGDIGNINRWKSDLEKNIRPLALQRELKDPPGESVVPDDEKVLDLRNWSEMEFRNFFEAIRHDRVSLILVVALLALVAMLNIAATLLVLYLERDRDLAVLVAMGLQPSQLKLWISYQGLVLGLLSSVLGLALALLLAQVLPYVPWFKLPPDIYNVSSLPFSFDLLEQAAVLLYGTLSGWGIAAFLGWRLSKTPVLDVLRHRR